jgi:hypothetical protein
VNHNMENAGYRLALNPKISLFAFRKMFSAALPAVKKERNDDEKESGVISSAHYSKLKSTLYRAGSDGRQVFWRGQP